MKAREKDKHNTAVTLQHVGDCLGLSRTTISLALRNHPRISPGTKEKVVAVAKKFGYQPDQLARALVTGRLGLVGLVVPNTADYYYAEVFRGIEDAAQETGIAFAA
jgi:LacI family transcriptional regulator